jgi:hypothetical protein
MNLKIVSVIALLVGPGLYFMGAKEEARLAKLTAEGVEVDGAIMGGESSRSRRSKSYKMDVMFQPTDGSAPVTQNFKVTSTFYKEHSEGSSVKEPMVKVIYDPKDKSNAIIKGGSDDDTAMKPVGMIGAILGLLGCLYFFVLKKKRAEVSAPPPLPQ